MARIDEIIYSITQAAPAITAICSDRVEPLRKSQNSEFPAIAYHVTSHKEGLSMAGPDGLYEARFDIGCLANTYTSARELATAVQSAFHGYRGAVSGGFVQGIMFLDEDDMYSDDPKRFTIVQDYRIFYCQ